MLNTGKTTMTTMMKMKKKRVQVWERDSVREKIKMGLLTSARRMIDQVYIYIAK